VLSMLSFVDPVLFMMPLASLVLSILFLVSPKLFMLSYAVLCYACCF
jgi:hypothetical protein